MKVESLKQQLMFHLLLKDEELQKLQQDYSNCKQLITYLDEYIEMKGYKAKSHYLAIKKWVVDAVKKTNNCKVNNMKTSNMSVNRNYSISELESFYDNM